MKSVIRFTIGLFLMGFLASCAEIISMKAPAGPAFYVSTEGNDAWSGRLPKPNEWKTNGPFATLKRARNAIRELKKREELPDGGITVYLRGGVYSLAQSMEWTALDSGDETHPIVVRAYPGEVVRIQGGKEITGFQPVIDDVLLARFDPSCRDKVVQVDLRRLGITNYGQLTPRGFGRPTQPAALELFFDDKPMTLARYPNEGWLMNTDAPDGPQGGKFTYSDEHPSHWAKTDNLWVHGYWTWDWADSYVQVQSIDPASHLITTMAPHGVYGYTKERRFYFLNVLEELDQPGEWILDRSSGVLYFYPPAPLKNRRAQVSLLEAPLLIFHDASNITIRDLILETTRGHGVEITGGSHVLIGGCTLRNIGNAAVVIQDGANHGVTGCDITNTGDGGIRLAGGDRISLTPANNFADNNHIYQFSRWVRTYVPAVLVSGVGNRVSHNLIHDAPHAGILISGNEHQIEFNEIHDICQETGDVGAFYMGRDWTMRGNLIRFNFFHHLHGPYTHGAMAVYLDDAASGAPIYGNVFYQASRAAFIGGGRDNIVENNIFVECEPSVHVDARGLGWAKQYITPEGEWRMYDKLKEVNYRQPPYSLRYPKLASIVEEDPAAPRGNAVVRNISMGGKWLNIDGFDSSLVAFQDNLVDVDPHFVDPAHMNFQLKPDSPAYPLGFKAIPFDEIGLYKSEYRRRVEKK